MPKHATISGSTIPASQLGSGTPDGTKFLRDDNVWAAPGGGPGATDHGALTGLADDDHTQYHNDTRGDARYSLLGHNHTGTYQPLATVLTNTTAAFTTAQETKLAGIETGATADMTGAEIVSAIDTQLGSTTWQGGGGGGGSPILSWMV